MSGLKRVMAFVTSKEAKLFNKENGEVTIEVIESPISLKDDKIPGETKDTFKFSATHASNNEHKKNNQHIHEEHQYFKKIEEKLAQYDIIYLTGPGTLKNKLNNYLTENKKFAEKSVFVEPAGNHLTEKQMLAKAKSVLF